MGQFPPVCKGCDDRAVGCHGSCERYLSVKSRYDAEELDSRADRKVYGDVQRVKSTGVKAMRKRRHDRYR